MVQVGNEINNGMCGETDASNVRKLLASGSKAVRDAATASGKIFWWLYITPTSMI